MPFIRDSDALCDEFENFADNAALEITKTQQEKNLARRKVLEISDEVSHTADSIVTRLRELYAGETEVSLLQIKDNLRAQAEEQCRKRDAVLEKKLEMKAAKSAMDIKLKDLKKEIEKLSQENKQMEQQTKELNLPLILKLMSSKSWD